MASFLDFLDTYAIWIYIAGVVGILFGIKMLVDSRRLARTTMFTLEQEQAGDKAFRAILVMLIFMGLIGGVSAVNAFVSPNRPSTTPVVLVSTALFTPIINLPTFTSVPTLPGGGSTDTPEPPDTAPTATSEPLPPLAATPTHEVSALPPPATPVAPSKSPTEPSGLGFPKPQLNAPRDSEPLSSDNIRFIWGQDQLPTQLPDGQFYRVVVHYTDRATNQPFALPKCTQSNATDARNWQPLLDSRHKATDFKYTWSVTVMQLPPNSTYVDCDAGKGTAISPESDTFTFLWP